MGPERATMALTFEKADIGIQGREGRERERTEGDIQEGNGTGDRVSR